MNRLYDGDCLTIICGGSTYRYNRRAANGVEDTERASVALFWCAWEEISLPGLVGRVKSAPERENWQAL